MNFYGQVRRQRRKFGRSYGGDGILSGALKNKHNEKKWRKKQLHFMSWKQHSEGNQHTVDQ